MSTFQIIPIQQIASDYFIDELSKLYKPQPPIEEYRHKFSIPNLDDLLKEIEQAPETNPPSVVAPPPQIDYNLYKQLQDLQLLHSYISVVSLGLVQQVLPPRWSINDPYQAVFYQRTMGDAAFQVMSQGLSGILNLQQSVLHTLEQKTTTAEIHTTLLEELFSSFGFPPSTKAQLDSIMTNIVKGLQSLSLTFETKTEYLNFLVIFYYFEEVMGTDFKIPMLRLFTLNVSQESWLASVRIGKSSGSIEPI
ncbi:MAG: hypothetical protein RM021_009955 [Nostoc sp. EkiNYC01]|nr:hypothetical protein [Nostoc sp. EkiNYC01]